MSAADRLATVFMGSDPIAIPFLDALEKAVPAIRLVAVYTQPDRPKGRGQKLQANEIKQWAQARDLPVHQPERCGPEDADRVRREGIACVLVMAYGQLLKPDFLQAPTLGIYNLHTSLLPRYRGASPMHTALAEGEKTTGVTLMRVTPEMDSGPIIDQEPVTIEPTLTSPELIERMAQACVPLIARGLPRLLDGSAEEREQDPAAVTFCRRIFKEDAQLDFRVAAEMLDRRIRAFQPWPGTLCEHEGVPLRIGAATIVPSPGGPPGTVHRPTEGSVVVTCGAEALQLLALQRPGGRMLPAEEFLRGYDLPAGTVLPSLPMAPLVGRRPFPWRWRPGDPVEGIV